MTKSQHKKAKKKALASRQRTKDAIDWLVQNDPQREKHLKDCGESKIPEPVIADHAKTAESANTNIELTEEMSIAFPDSSLNEMAGRCGSAKGFEEIVPQLSKGNAAAAVASKASSCVCANKDDNSIKVFPLQFPCGVSDKSPRLLALAWLNATLPR
jgi:hypothetical protein